MTIGSTIIGDEQLAAVMRHMTDTASRKVMAAGSAKAAQFIAKRIKASIPSSHKGARRGIGWRRLKKSEARDGGAKAGVKVGKPSKAKIKERPPSQKGKGFGAQNAHWVFYGVGPKSIKSGQPRVTGKKGGPVRHTGGHKPFAPPARETAKRNKSAAMAIYKQAAAQALSNEVRKGKAF